MCYRRERDIIFLYYGGESQSKLQYPSIKEKELNPRN